MMGGKTCQPFRTVCFFESEGCRSLRPFGPKFFEELWDTLITTVWETILKLGAEQDLVESHLIRRLFGSVVRRIEALAVATG